MAKIKFTGKEDKRIPGVGPVGAEWVPCPDETAREFKDEPGFEVQLDAKKSTHPHPGLPLEREGAKVKDTSIGGDQT